MSSKIRRWIDYIKYIVILLVNRVYFKQNQTKPDSTPVYIIFVILLDNCCHSQPRFGFPLFVLNSNFYNKHNQQIF